ncbi:hypothetical protein PaeCFBP13512_21620 [Paenibacillus sp. CFBP13512]|uniref:hypothetical protein n=1 Tax=Paenibacillus sp. CFBP13512 TaxID=2184007 RepID=UPI0010C0D838|nr:hypothetical protein [Paenibacillus sp. CFBP13512]TKJ84377.1 hypothetical protein PaeCFBP13512_21620 [Paenibacillus sp. CFBP13512]
MRVKSELPILKSQPIRISSSWKVDYNTFVELDPKTLNEKWINFTEDLLQMSYIRDNIIWDIGWYPEANPLGEYGLELIKNLDWSNPIESYSTKHKVALLAKLEYLLWAVGQGYYN